MLDGTTTNKSEAVETDENNTLIFNHDTVAKAMAGATTVGAAVGGVVGAAIAPDLAQKASNAVRDTIKKEGDKIAEQILHNTGLDKIPGGQLLVKNQVTDIAHSAGEGTYKSVKDELATRGAVMGGATAGIATVVVMEGVNMGSALYSNYVTPYFDARREQAEIVESYKKFQCDPSNQVIDNSPVEMDKEFEGFVLVKKSGV